MTLRNLEERLEDWRSNRQILVPANEIATLDYLDRGLNLRTKTN